MPCVPPVITVDATPDANATSVAVPLGRPVQGHSALHLVTRKNVLRERLFQFVDLGPLPRSLGASAGALDRHGSGGAREVGERTRLVLEFQGEKMGRPLTQRSHVQKAPRRIYILASSLGVAARHDQGCASSEHSPKGAINSH